MPASNGPAQFAHRVLPRNPLLLAEGIPNAAGLQKDGFLGFMLMLAGIVIQKHLFILMGMDTGKLGWKRLVLPGFHDLCILAYDVGRFP